MDSYEINIFLLFKFLFILLKINLYKFIDVVFSYLIKKVLLNKYYFLKKHMIHWEKMKK